MDIQLARLTTVIDAVATRHFYPHLLAYLERFFAFDNALVYAFEQDRPPCCLLKAEKENSDRVNALYQQGAYLQDPFYHALNDGRQGISSRCASWLRAVSTTAITTAIFTVKPAGATKRALCCS